MNEHIFRDRNWKLENGELWRRVTECGVEKWVCITTCMASPLERTILSLLREVVER